MAAHPMHLVALRPLGLDIRVLGVLKARRVQVYAAMRAGPGGLD
jgi:hypothetical protein